MPPSTSNKLAANSPEYEAFSSFAKLTARKRELASEIKEIDTTLKAMEPQLLTFLGEGGYQAVSVEGFTLSPHREPWVGPGPGQTRASVCQALKAAGLAHYVREDFSTRSLTTFIKEIETRCEDQIASGEITSVLDVLPPELRGALRVAPTYRVNVMKNWRK